MLGQGKYILVDLVEQRQLKLEKTDSLEQRQLKLEKTLTRAKTAKILGNGLTD